MLLKHTGVIYLLLQLNPNTFPKLLQDIPTAFDYLKNKLFLSVCTVRSCLSESKAMFIWAVLVTASSAKLSVPVAVRKSKDEPRPDVFSFYTHSGFILLSFIKSDGKQQFSASPEF